MTVLNTQGGAGKVAARMRACLRKPPLAAWRSCLAVLLLAALASDPATAAEVSGTTSEPLPPQVAAALLERAKTDSDPEVRAQLAATARRLPPEHALPIVAALLGRDEDLSDPYIPLLCWWVLEHHLGEQRGDVLALFKDAAFWDRPMVFEHILPRLMRRFASAGRREDLLVCARLLRAAPSPRHAEQLMEGLEEAFRGRALTGLPDELVTALAKVTGAASLALRLRQADAAAVAEALALVRDPKAKLEDRQLYTRAFGELRLTNALPALLALATAAQEVPLRKAAFSALSAFEDDAIATRAAELLPQLSAEVRPTAFALLASRPKWTHVLLRVLHASSVSLSSVPAEMADRLRTHPDAAIRAAATKLFPKPDASNADFAKHLAAVEGALRAGPGNPYAGEPLFMQRCAACHKLFFKGGSVGPDLTQYQRDNLGTMLLSILNPNAEIREGYAAVEVETKDGRSLTGFVADRDANVLVLRTLDGQDTTLRQSEVQSLQPTGRSLMPEGLLDDLTDQQFRDLFAYLRSSQPMTR